MRREAGHWAQRYNDAALEANVRRFLMTTFALTPV